MVNFGFWVDGRKECSGDVMSNGANQLIHLHRWKTRWLKSQEVNLVKVP